MASFMTWISKFVRLPSDDCRFSGELSRFAPESLVTMRIPVLRAHQKTFPVSADYS